jgi:hypothetical protein
MEMPGGLAGHEDLLNKRRNPENLLTTNLPKYDNDTITIQNT